jgi:hypothetical protein
MAKVEKENVIESQKFFILPLVGEVKYNGKKVPARAVHAAKGGMLVPKIKGMTSEGFEVEPVVLTAAKKEEEKPKKATKRHVKSTGE